MVVSRLCYSVGVRPAWGWLPGVLRPVLEVPPFVVVAAVQVVPVAVPLEPAGPTGRAERGQRQQAAGDQLGDEGTQPHGTGLGFDHGAHCRQRMRAPDPRHVMRMPQPGHGPARTRWGEGDV